MGIRKKTSISIFIAVTISVGLFYMVTDHAIDTRFTALEKQQAQSRLHATLRLLENGRDGLLLLVRDWSLWNDSYNFLADRNETFIESNLMEETYADTGLSYIGFFPVKGDTVWEGYYDHVTQKMTFPPHALTQVIGRLMKNLRLRGAGSEVEPGFFVNSGTFHFIAARPVVRSDGSGPSRGWLIMVQQLDKNFFHDLLANTQTEVSVASRPSPGKPDAVHFHFTDKRKQYACEGTLNDILGHPTIEVTLTGPSEIYLAGRRLLALTGAGISVTGILLGLLTYLLIQRTLLRRLLTLRHQVAPVATPGAPVKNVHPRGSDELSDLAMDINRVFKRIIEEECLNRNILTALNVGVILVDGKTGKIREANTCMEEMLEKKGQDLVGQPAAPLFQPSGENDRSQRAPHQEKGMLNGKTPRQVIRTRTETRYHDAPIRIETFTEVQAMDSQKKMQGKAPTEVSADTEQGE